MLKKEYLAKVSGPCREAGLEHFTLGISVSVSPDFQVQIDFSPEFTRYRTRADSILPMVQNINTNQHTRVLRLP
jgi:hypothetical protein